ncbi:tetratricopeptide repeat protein [Motilimonas pumila]|uniref:GGDEF domain-containing protein n=1 Tax=Motilimonas pumila TaxID=2303987 RepID=A0A418YJP2_9GAMM|nr:hypothetical protein [Motilimonas pumila]RJG51201.1 hypothetical protein D1Z90_00205 [Motilimonas pumila]
MKLSRLIPSWCLFICLGWFSLGLQAQDIINMDLNRELGAAYQLHRKAPLQCIEIVDEFLSENKTQLQQSRNAFNNKDSFSLSSDNTQAIIHAFQIKSICYSKLKNLDQAQVNIEIAIELAQVNKQLFELAHSQLLFGQLLFDQAQKPIEALRQVQQASLQAESLSGDETANLQLAIHLALADFYTQKDKFQQANQELEAAKSIANKLGQAPLIAWVNFYWGRYYIRISQPQLALSHYVDAKSMAENTQDQELIARATHEISDIYRIQGKLDKALHYANLSASAYQELEDERELAHALIYMAILHRKNQEYSLSMVYFGNAEDLLTNLKDVPGIALCYFEMGKTFLKMHSVDEARDALNTARFQFKKLDDTKRLADTLLLLGRLNIEQGEAGIARIQLEKVLAISESLALLEQRERAYELLAAAYELTGHYRKAIENFKQFHALQTKIKQLEFTLEQNKFNEQYQLIERTQQITVLEQDNQKLSDKLQIFLTVTVVIAALLFVLFYRYTSNWLKLKHLKNSNRQLNQQLNQHPSTLLPLFTDQVQQSLTHTNQRPAEIFCLLTVPFLNEIYQQFGVLKAQRIEKEFGMFLQTRQKTGETFYQVKDNQLLFICPREPEHNPAKIADKLAQKVDEFASKHDLNTRIAMGMIGFPFLPKAPGAIDHKRGVDLAYLALLGAQQLQVQHEQTWLELYAIDCPQAAFFNGDIWQLGQQAIAKGLVKVNCNGDKTLLSWPLLQASHHH